MEIFGMTMSLYTFLLLLGGGFLAGFIDSIAGGGGLVSLPVLLASGMPTHFALGTNKFSATFGAVMSAWQFWRAGKVDRALLKKLLPFTFLGAAAGCMLMVFLSAALLRPIVIAALIGTAVFVFTKRDLGVQVRSAETIRHRLVKGIAAAFLIGAYDGFVGPGTGTFLIMSFAMLGFDFIVSAGNAKVLNLMSNATSLALLIYWRQILYFQGLVMAAAIFGGAYFGSRLAIRRGSSFIWYVMLTVTTVLIGKLLLEYVGIL